MTRRITTTFTWNVYFLAPCKRSHLNLTVCLFIKFLSVGPIWGMVSRRITINLQIGSGIFKKVYRPFRQNLQLGTMQHQQFYSISQEGDSGPAKDYHHIEEAVRLGG